jgi:sec-independent protein translocase protein TatB
VFDIGFTELLVCLVVALVVIGPEQLPGTVRTVGLWIGRLKRSLRETRSEIERQIGADDIRRQLHNEEILYNLEEARKKIEATMAEAAATAALNPPTESMPETTPPAAHHYGPPDELPDHAHGPDTHIDQNHQGLDQSTIQRSDQGSGQDTADSQHSIHPAVNPASGTGQ